MSTAAPEYGLLQITVIYAGFCDIMLVHVFVLLPAVKAA